MDSNKKEESVKNRLVFDRSDWMALLAVIISTGAFLVAIYEANILKQQQSTMVTQQKASVWPYMESEQRYSIDNEYTSMFLSFENKGVGPAKLSSFDLFINGEHVQDSRSITKILKSTFDEGDEYIHSYRNPSSVLSAGSKIQVLELKRRRSAGDLMNFKGIKLEFQLCFCNIYGDCWTVNEGNGEPQEGCTKKL